MKKRIGYVRRADVPAALLRQLNAGKAEALTLAESLSVDFAKLMRSAFPGAQAETIARMRAAADTGWVGRTRLAGQILHDDLGAKILPDMIRHTSDQVRGWGASLIAAQPRISLARRLALVRPLADDPNPGVRETAWIMLRPFIAADLKESFALLAPWVRDDRENIRRYASEITRPRGVWCAYIPALREKPQQALALLRPLRADPARYVQNSVANWLNDASKDQPDWVRHVTQTWQKQHSGKETAYICKRALRSLNKK